MSAEELSCLAGVYTVRSSERFSDEVQAKMLKRRAETLYSILD